MKFYLIIAPVIFCFIYTTTIFGAENTDDILEIPENIFGLIDEFRAPEKDHYLETGHVEIRNHKKEACDILSVSYSNDLISFTRNNNTPEAYNCPEECFLSLSDMKGIERPREKIKEDSYWSFYDFFFGQGSMKYDAEKLLIIRDEKNAITNKFNGKLGIFKCMKENVYIRATGDKYAFKEKPNHICTLEATEKLKAFSVSEDGKIIVTCGKGGHIRKWELQEPLKKGYKMSDIYRCRKVMAKHVNHREEKLIRPENKKKMVPVTEFVNLQSEKITSSEGGKRVVFSAKNVICKAVQIITITGMCYYFFKDFLSELFEQGRTLSLFF